jgi:hypothetical protein
VSRSPPPPVSYYHNIPKVYTQSNPSGKAKRPLTPVLKFHPSERYLRKKGMRVQSFLFLLSNYIFSFFNRAEEDDIEEFEDRRETLRRQAKRQKATSKCVRCHQNKMNRKCELDMCLACCGACVNEPCSVKDHEKEKSIQGQLAGSSAKGGHRLVRSFLQRLNLEQY